MAPRDPSDPASLPALGGKRVTGMLWRLWVASESPAVATCSRHMRGGDREFPVWRPSPQGGPLATPRASPVSMPIQAR